MSTNNESKQNVDKHKSKYLAQWHKGERNENRKKMWTLTRASPRKPRLCIYANTIVYAHCLTTGLCSVLSHCPQLANSADGVWISNFQLLPQTESPFVDGCLMLCVDAEQKSFWRRDCTIYHVAHRHRRGKFVDKPNQRLPGLSDLAVASPSAEVSL